MTYQFVVYDDKNYIMEYKNFSEFEEDKLVDYVTTRLEKLKNLYRIEIKRFDQYHVK